MAHVYRIRGLLLFGIALAVPGAWGADPSPTAAVARPNVILVSIDTTRADALSCYGGLAALGHPEGTTPNLDALAAQGARFERFYAHAPTTLSSHASMLTGRDPHAHAIPRNGFPVLPGTATVAERLQEAGYDTVAVVGAAALEAEMGLDRGFRVYDDRFSVQLGPQFQDRADGVVRRVFEAIDARSGGPLFLWAHFFDPHQPYDPPDRFMERLGDADPSRPVGFATLRTQLGRGTADAATVRHVAALYQAEVSYVDEQVGVLLDGLRTRGLLDRAVVIVVADHGEILAEIPGLAYTHGSDVTDGSTHVPLIVRGYGVPLAERAVVHRQAEMAGLAPTIEALAGLVPTLGASFAELVRPGPVDDVDGWPRPTRPVFQEATRPYDDDPTRWNNLRLPRAVRAGGFTLLAEPQRWSPYLRGAGTPVEVQPTLEGLLTAWDAASPPGRTPALSDATTEALRALGYVDEH